MPIGLIIGLSCSSLILFIVFLVFSLTNYKKRFDLVYDLRNHFPYEINYKSRFNDNLIGNICLIASMVLSISSFACASYYLGHYYLLIVAILSGSLYSLLNIFLFFSDIKYLKFHIFVVVLLSGLSFLTPASIGLVGLFLYQQKESIPGLVYLIIGLLIGVFSFALIMNPKFSFNIQMKVVKLENGEEEVRRPTFIVMAFSEWLMTLFIFLSHILFILLLFLL